jgi:ribosomal protein S25
MQAVLEQADLYDALDKFGNKDSKLWSDDEKKKDRKALSHIHLHLSKNILQEVLKEKAVAALWLKLEVNLHVKRFDKQDAYEDEVIYAQVARRWLCGYPSFGL